MNVPASGAADSEWLVYADALQQAGNPLGELIALVHSGNVEKRDQFLEKNPSLLGPLAEHYNGPLKLSWKWGFIEQATVLSGPAFINEIVDALISFPLAQRLTTLRLEVVPQNDTTPIALGALVQRIATSAHPTLSKLALIDQRANLSTTLTSRDFDVDPNLVDFGSLAPLWRMKNLRELTVQIADLRQLDTGTIDAPELESLTLLGLRLAGQNYGDTAEPADCVTALGEARLPKLKSFEMRLCEEWTVNYVDDTGAYIAHDVDGDGEDDEGSNEGADWATEFGPAMRGLARSPLQRLALTNFASTTEALTVLATNWPKGLKVLDLSESSLSKTDLPWFTSNASLLAGLETLIVRETGFTDDDANELRALVKNVEHSHREGNEVLPKYRFTIGME